jgi:phospholipase C
MGIVISRSGLKVNLDAALPFNNAVRMAFRIPTTWQEETINPFETTRNPHLWLLFQAASLLEPEGIAGRKIHNLIQPQDGVLNDDFRDALIQGLWDADNKASYNDLVWGAVPTWKSHFYDPDTRTNWTGQTTPTALSEGWRYYHQSQRAFQRERWEDAGYALGLSLHYVTDLTQPMHAANFTWIHSQSFGYHTDFERYVKDTLHLIDAPTAYVPLLPDTSLAALIHNIARYSKDRYFAQLCRARWTQNYSEAARAESVWQERVGMLVPNMLADAVQITAQFLLMWNKDVSSSTLRKLPALARG